MTTSRQRALLELLHRIGYAEEPLHYAVTQPGKPHPDVIWMELARNYAVRAREERQGVMCNRDDALNALSQTASVSV